MFQSTVISSGRTKLNYFGFCTFKAKILLFRKAFVPEYLPVIFIQNNITTVVQLSSNNEAEQATALENAAD